MYPLVRELAVDGTPVTVTCRLLKIARQPYYRTGEGKLYLYAIEDCFSNTIVGYPIGSPMKARLAVTALENAIARRRAEGADVAGRIVHADRGSQLRSRKFHDALARHGLVDSMGQVASAADNPATESFFSLPQKKCPRPAGVA